MPQPQPFQPFARAQRRDQKNTYSFTDRFTVSRPNQISPPIRLQIFRVTAASTHETANLLRQQPDGAALLCDAGGAQVQSGATDFDRFRIT